MALLLSTEPSIKEEASIIIVFLVETLADAQRRLQEVAERIKDSESDPEDWKTRYEELHRKSTETVNGAKWLETQIVDLEHKLGQQKPEMDSLLAARGAAFAKLKHARRVIRDLLDERRDMSSPRGSLTQADIDEALSDDMPRDDRSNSTGSDETVRIGGTSTLSPPISARASPAPSSRHRILSPSPSISSAGRHTRASTASRAMTSPRSNSSRSARSSPQKIYHLHWKSPPGSSKICEGPISWVQLHDFLKLDEDTMISLESLGSTPDVSMGLQITQLPNKEVVAFIHGPILLEQEGKSYIIDWGRAASNTHMSKYIDSYISKQKAFHTFHFPMTGNDWFYVGALRWNVAPTVPVWPLEVESRQKFLKKMCKRTRGEVKAAEMERRLDSGEIVQLSIELSVTDEDHQRSQVFAGEVLRLGGQ